MAITRFMVNNCIAGAAVAAAAVCLPAQALSLGEARSQVVLGQALSLAVPVLLGDGESLSGECARAEVSSGDNKLQPDMVRVRVTQGRDTGEAVIRIASTVAIDEPVVTVVVGVGCPTRVSRVLVLLAEPPTVGTERAPEPIAEPTATSAAAAPAAAEAPRRATRPAPRATRRAEASRSRLQLDAPQISPNAAAAQAQASAVQAALVAAEAAASAAQTRMRELDAEIAKVRSEARAQTDALLQLRRQIAQDQAQRERQDRVTPYLLAAAGVPALVAIWLGWRLRTQRKALERSAWYERPNAARRPAPGSEEDSRYGDSQRESSRFGTSQISRPVPMRPPPETPTVFQSIDPARAGVRDSILSPPTVPAPPTETIPPLPERADGTARAMTVDEQIDLEQQADFFIALGHDEAAIDLLMAHLRSSGGRTPLPFLKLLEIHRRRGNREAYERTRLRFNQRFNSVAPAWNVDPRAGRALEDYPTVIGRLQRAWPMPLDAMAELEALLFRRGPGAELFDLPAYQEVLFLYQLARDIHLAERPPESAATDVDVLLPISAFGSLPPVPPGSISLRPEFSDGGAPMSLDLDLTGAQDGRPADPADAQAVLPLTLDLDAPALAPAHGPESVRDNDSDATRDRG